MSNKYITISCLQSGQPRPYADHEFITDVIFTQDDGRIETWLGERSLPLVIPQYVDKEFAHKIARIHCPYMEPTDPNFNWASRRLIAFTRLEPTMRIDVKDIVIRDDVSNRWRIHVRAAFTD